MVASPIPLTWCKACARGFSAEEWAALELVGIQKPTRRASMFLECRNCSGCRSTLTKPIDALAMVNLVNDLARTCRTVTQLIESTREHERTRCVRLLADFSRRWEIIASQLSGAGFCASAAHANDMLAALKDVTRKVQS
jgi:hypothetical protein